MVALQALSEFATLVYSKDIDMRIDITTKKGMLPGPSQTIRLNPENHDVLQYRDVSAILTLRKLCKIRQFFTAVKMIIFR